MSSKNTKEAPKYRLPEAVCALWKAKEKVRMHYEYLNSRLPEKKRLKFTLDGRLVGDVGEAIALDLFDLDVPEKRAGGVDAITRGAKSKTVQIKVSGRQNGGAAFSPGKKKADHLIVMRLDFEKGTIAVVYNGLESPVREIIKKEGWVHTKVVKFETLELLQKQAVAAHALRIKNLAGLTRV